MDIRLTTASIIASFLFVVITTVHTWTVSLETQTGLLSGWELDGSFEYYKSWQHLPGKLKEFLPDDCDYKKQLHLSTGLWAVLSDPKKEESVATFGYHVGKDAVFQNVTLVSSIGGNATLYLMNGHNDTEPLYAIEPSSERKYRRWQTEMPIMYPTSWFYIKAVVHERPSYIIIDRIVAHFKEIVAPPKTSDEPPEETVSINENTL